MIIDKNDLRDFQQVNLVANKWTYGPKTVDTTLQNAWGLTWSPTGIAWVNSNGGHVSELYTAEGGIVRPGVRIPSPTDTMGGVPSGVVFSGGKGFALANDKQGSLFLFVGEDGVLSGWNGAEGNNALRIKDRSATSIYKGLALASSGGANYIYATNFKTGKIDVWDTTFAPVSMPFNDPGIPAGYAPFNIQAIGSWLFVTFAHQKPGSGDEMDGPGLGFVDVFNTDGSFVRRFASHGPLNAPWGVTMAPAGFLEENDMSADNGKGNSGSNSNDHSKKDVSVPVILVGNFGDGHINVFAEDGEFLGHLRSHSQEIVIDGLWALSFPPATATAIDPKRLYFTAGPNDENDGLFGYLIKQ
ncbi:MAG TPA: TIGR03118 family protein [Puia sp.]|nr:TIGR03118 family protein [Puia sp.]